MTLVQASQPDELTIDEQEMLEVIEDGDMEDWVKVHNAHHASSELFVFNTTCLLLDYMASWCFFSICICKSTSLSICVFQARNKTGHVGYVPEKYLQFPTSNSLLSMLQSLATLDARSHTSSNSTEPDLLSGCVNGDTNSKCAVNYVNVEYSA